MSTSAWGLLLPRLVARGTLDGDAALAGRVTVEPRSRSHDVAVILQDHHAVCVAKHHRTTPDPGDPAGTEVAVYRWLSRLATGAEVAGAEVAAGTVVLTAGDAELPGVHAGPLVPTLIDVVNGALLLEARTDDLPLHLALSDGRWPPAHLLAALGHLLARLHTTPAADPAPPRTDHLGAGGVARRGAGLPSAQPWVVAVADAALPPSLAGDPLLQQLAEEVAGDPALVGCLRAVGSAWADTAAAVVVHGDVKFDNVLVEDAAGPRGVQLGSRGVQPGPRLRLLDWELAAWGPAAWDLAGIIDGLLVPALQVLPVRQALDEQAHAAPALAAYRAVPGTPTIEAQVLRDATVARLVQSALQLLAMRHQEPARETAATPVLEGARALARRPQLVAV